MKKIKQIFITLFLIGVLFGCNYNQKQKDEIQLYEFEHNGKTMKLGEVFSIEKYGQPEDYTEVESCAFEGLDKTFNYGSYEVTTFSDNDKDKIYSIYFLDENVKTKEGIKITDSFDKMKKTYGDDYEKIDNMYTYTKQKTQLNFIINNNEITSIEYLYAVQ